MGSWNPMNQSLFHGMSLVRFFVHLAHMSMVSPPLELEGISSLRKDRIRRSFNGFPLGSPEIR